MARMNEWMNDSIQYAAPYKESCQTSHSFRSSIITLSVWPKNKMRSIATSPWLLNLSVHCNAFFHEQVPSLEYCRTARKAKHHAWEGIVYNYETRYARLLLMSHRRQSSGLRCHDPIDFGMEVVVGCWGLHDILSYPITYRNMRWEHFPNVVTFQR